MVVCLERGADLHMVQPMPLPLTVSCFTKIQIGFLVPADLGTPGKRAVKRVCVCVNHDSILQCHLQDWQQKSTGIDIEQNYVSVTLRISVLSV